MKKLFNSFLLLLLCFGLACTNEQTEKSDNQINEPFDISFHRDVTDFEDHFGEFEMIQLESGDDHLIGQIDKLMVLPSGIYALDIRNTSSLYKFDLSGKFVFKISDVGTEPAQFVLPFDFDVNEEVGEIYISDVNQRKMMRYSIKDGKYLGHHKFDFQAKSFISINDIIFSFQLDGRDFPNDKPIDLLITYDFDKKSKTGSYVAEYPFTDYFRPRLSFTRNDGTIIFSKGMHDVVYQWYEDKFLPIAYLDFKDRKVTNEVKAMDMMGMRESLIKNELYMHNGSFAKAGDHLLFNWMDENDEYLGYYNGSQKKLHNLSSEKFPIKTVFGVYKGSFISSVYSYELPEDSPYYSKTDDTNPLIVLFKMKTDK